MEKRFSKKAKRHAAESSMRTRRMLREAKGKSGPVTISYLPGFFPPRTKFPFAARINGRPVTVWDDWIEYENEGWDD